MVLSDYVDLNGYIDFVKFTKPCDFLQNPYFLHDKIKILSIRSITNGIALMGDFKTGHEIYNRCFPIWDVPNRFF